jgi:hypothetical protein
MTILTRPSVAASSLGAFRGYSHDTQDNDDLSRSGSIGCSQSGVGSRVQLQGIHKGPRTVEAGLRVWNISVHVHCGAAG